MTARLGLAAALLAGTLVVAGCAYEPPAEYIRVGPDQYRALTSDTANVNLRQEGDWTLVHVLGPLQADMKEKPGELDFKTYRIVTGWYTIRTDQVPSGQ